MKNEYETFDEQFEGKKPIGKRGCRRKINLKDIGSRVWPNELCRWNVDAIMKKHVLQKERNSLDKITSASSERLFRVDNMFNDLL